MTRVSVVVNTFRPGGLDITLAGMRDQTFKDFEVILVDHRYERRHRKVMALAREYGVNLIHIPEHRRNGKWFVALAGSNTGIAVARGDIVIFLQDWTYTPPGWLEAHLQHHLASPTYVAAPYVYYTDLPALAVKKTVDQAKQEARSYRPSHRCTDEDDGLRGDVFDEVFSFKDGPFDPRWFAQMVIAVGDDQPIPYPPSPAAAPYLASGPLPANCAHMKNDSFLREMALEVNGVDERFERGRGPADTEWSLRLELAGARLWWEPGAITPSPSARRFCRSMPWGAFDERVEGRWSHTDGLAYNTRREREARAGDVRARNPYDLRDLAVRLAKWREADVIDVSGLDKPDLTYWGGEIWPDSD